MKQCYACKLSKPESDFFKCLKRKDGLQSKCKVCHKSAKQLHYQENKSRYIDNNKKYRHKVSDTIRERKGQVGCLFCKESEPCCLDYHHLEPNEKSFAIGQFASGGYGLKKLQTEADKCVVLCRNCHSKVHAGILKM